ncbi:hypothetical protein EVAR_34320_1 [Eumeta japonica]|uniref:Uncharacterized protein n=1 Tax=Eumeta variegata TaxID=151549 RepID=A0A4C1VEB0_EUMVA|nr:hypothetical protein EVAR_34320_1 [Eumeta japonica]
MKICRCEVSHESVAMEKNWRTGEEKEGSGSVKPDTLKLHHSQAIPSGKVSRVVLHRCPMKPCVIFVGRVYGQLNRVSLLGGDLRLVIALWTYG